MRAAVFETVLVHAENINLFIRLHLFEILNIFGQLLQLLIDQCVLSHQYLSMFAILGQCLHPVDLFLLDLLEVLLRLHDLPVVNLGDIIADDLALYVVNLKFELVNLLLKFVGLLLFKVFVVYEVQV